MDPSWHQHTLHHFIPPRNSCKVGPLSVLNGVITLIMSMVITPQSPNHVRPFKEVITPFVTGSRAHLVEKHPPPVSLVVLRYHPARASTNHPVALSTATCHDRTWATARGCSGEQGAVLFGRFLD